VARIGVCTGPVGGADSNTLLIRNVAAGDYTYSQAVSQGLDVPPTPAQWALPQCASDDTFDGFATEDDAESAATAAPDDPACATDPSGSSVSVGDPLMHSVDPVTGIPGAYHYAGYQTNGTWRGGRLTVEATNPFVDHTTCRLVGCQEFVASRLLAKSKFATSFRRVRGLRSAGSSGRFSPRMVRNCIRLSSRGRDPLRRSTTHRRPIGSFRAASTFSGCVRAQVAPRSALPCSGGVTA
jgi:hypothetical protein